MHKPGLLCHTHQRFLSSLSIEFLWRSIIDRAMLSALAIKSDQEILLFLLGWWWPAEPLELWLWLRLFSPVPFYALVDGFQHPMRQIKMGSATKGGACIWAATLFVLHAFWSAQLPEGRGLSSESITQALYMMLSKLYQTICRIAKIDSIEIEGMLCHLDSCCSVQIALSNTRVHNKLASAHDERLERRSLSDLDQIARMTRRTWMSRGQHLRQWGLHCDHGAKFGYQLEHTFLPCPWESYPVSQSSAGASLPHWLPAAIIQCIWSKSLNWHSELLGDSLDVDGWHATDETAWGLKWCHATIHLP